MAGSPAERLEGAVADFPARLARARVVGVLRAPNADAAVHATLAAVRGGLRAVEVTFTTPGAATALRELCGTLPPDVLLGAGTVTTAAVAERALEAGAQFLVSPHLAVDVVAFGRACGAPVVPGALTPTEVAQALALGVDVVKLFPIGSSGGAGYLRDLLGPFPHLGALVTGGVEPRDVPAYLRVGAVAVGLGSQLFGRDALTEGRWDEVEAAVRAALLEAGVS